MLLSALANIHGKGPSLEVVYKKLGVPFGSSIFLLPDLHGQRRPTLKVAIPKLKKVAARVASPNIALPPPKKVRVDPPLLEHFEF